MEHGGKARLTDADSRCLPAVLARLSVLAAQEITRHIRKDGLWVSAGLPGLVSAPNWPSTTLPCCSARANRRDPP
jgi:hypothetical protein